MNPKVDFYFNKAKKWQEEAKQLRTIALECGLEEELKWGVPCYALQKRNIILIHEFKDYCAFLFFKGVLLSDPLGILIQQTPNVQAARQIRFTNIDQLIALRTMLKSYIFEAIEIEKAGLTVEFKETNDFKIIEEFQIKLDELDNLRTAFYGLTPGRQKAYLLYFAAPKQTKTKEARIEKSIPNILIGKGLNDE